MASLIFLIGGCFIFVLAMSRPDPKSLFEGFIPRERIFSDPKCARKLSGLAEETGAGDQRANQRALFLCAFWRSTERSAFAFAHLPHPSLVTFPFFYSTSSGGCTFPSASSAPPSCRTTSTCTPPSCRRARLARAFRTAGRRSSSRLWTARSRSSSHSSSTHQSSSWPRPPSTAQARRGAKALRLIASCADGLRAACHRQP